MKGYIVVLDDNPLDLKVVSRVVTGEGYECMSFTDHIEAMRWLNKNTPHMMFLDLVMPRKSGFDLIPDIRKIAAIKKVPLIILSGRNQSEDVRKAISLGANDYVVKPIDPMVLQEKIRKSSNTMQEEFPEVFLHTEQETSAYVIKPLHIRSFNEFGVTIDSSESFAPDQIIILTGTNAEIFGQDELHLKVYSTTPAPDQKFSVRLTYVGMTENQRQHIRNSARKLWVKHKGGLA